MQVRCRTEERAWWPSAIETRYIRWRSRPLATGALGAGYSKGRASIRCSSEPGCRVWVLCCNALSKICRDAPELFAQCAPDEIPAV